jgi:hypothetical protein
MADETSSDVKVPPRAGLVDGLQAAGRSALLLIGFASALLAFFKAHDLAGAAVYFQNNIGQAVAAVLALAGFVSAAYGIFKTSKRGGQLEQAAADPRNKGVTFK